MLSSRQNERLCVRLGQLTIPLKITEREDIICDAMFAIHADPTENPGKTASGRKDWTAKQVAAERLRIMLTYKEQYDRDGFDTAFAWLNQLVDGQGADNDLQQNLTIFCAALLILQIDLQDDYLNAGKRRRLYELVEAILKVQGIDADSRLGFLASQLKQIKALDAVRQGRPWLALFDQVLAWQTGRRSHHARLHALTCLTTGLRALRLGLSELALESLLIAEQGGLDDSAFILARITRIQTLRLSQDYGAAQQLVSETRQSLHLNQEAALELSWEEAIIAGIVGGEDSWRDLFNLCRRGRSHYEVTYLLEAHLWARVMPSLKYLEILPKLATVKSNAGARVTRNIRFSLLIDVLNCLETIYEPGIQTAIKLPAVASVSDRLSNLPGIDRELLATLGLARWAFRQNLHLLGKILLAAYGKLSQSLSGGRSADVLALAPTPTSTPTLSASA